THANQFVWGYVAQYPGVVMLHTLNVANLRVAMLASRAVVVRESGLAELLQALFPDANVRYAPACAPNGVSLDPSLARRSREVAEAAGPRTGRFAVFDERGGGVVDRAFDRARNAGAVFDVLPAAAPSQALGRCDVVIAPGWPPFQTRPTALAAMAAAKAVVTT